MNAVLADFGKRTRQEDPLIHFYETFLAEYDPKLKELRGVYYTPEPVVSYIVRSVDHLLRTQFNCRDGLADTSAVTYMRKDEHGKEHEERKPRVLLLDPACGTGTFSYAVINHIRESYRQTGNAGMWSSYVREHLLPRLFGFELLMAPYAMAHLKLGMQLAALDLPEEERRDWAYDFKGKERLGIFLTNTLEEAVKRSEMLFARSISDEANEAAKVKQEYPVMVVLGNPPYSYESANTGPWISALVRDYYQVDGKPLKERNPKALQDDYVKFIRFAQWRIEQTGYGILAFICNHRYLSNTTFPGMRQSLMRTFDDIYLLNLHGSTKPKETPPLGLSDQNVFDIQQGVCIGIFVKHHGKSQDCSVYYADLWGLRESKYAWLSANEIATTQWTKLNPQTLSYYFVPQDRNRAEEYERGWKITEMMPVNSVGLYTARDSLAIQWSEAELLTTLKDFISLPVETAREQYGLGEDSRDWQVALAQKDVRLSVLNESKVQQIAYRPFDTRFTYYTGTSRGLICMPRSEVMYNMINGYNLAICFMRHSREQIVSNFYVANHIVDKTILSSADNANVAPLYIYPDTNTHNNLFAMSDPNVFHEGPRPNLASRFTEQLAGQLGLEFISRGKGDLQKTFGPEDIFDYMYAVFHAPTYRERYAEFLKIDFPRLPLTSNADLFRELCGLGDRLVGLHLMETLGKAMPGYPKSGDDLVEKIEYTAPGDNSGQGRVWINKEQYFEGVPSDVWEFHVGGYQVCQKWLKDRKGRTLSHEDIRHYQQIVAVLAETITLMGQSDEVIDEHGGWPIE
jgi:predicted helicase